MNLELLRPFDKKAAQRGEEICWYDGTETLAFLAEAGPDGEYALRDADGNVLRSRGIHLRMRPLAWVEDRPVYKDSTLYSKYTGHAYLVGEVEVLDWDAVTWTKPEPVKKTRTVTFLAYRTSSGELVLYETPNNLGINWKRVPGADVTYEVEE